MRIPKNISNIIILLLLLTGGGSIEAQICRIIGDYPIEYGYSTRIGTRPFVGSFEFDSLPEPLKPTRVKFTLNSIGHPGIDRAQDWLIKLHFLDNTCRITGDTIFHWFGTHKQGEIFEGSFEFMPLISGRWGIGLSLYNIDGGRGAARESGISFEWFLNEDGELLYLSKVKKENRVEYIPIRTFFFNDDSIFITQFPDERKYYLFEYEIIVNPIPRFGDTTTIHYYLKANDNIPEGCYTIFDVGSMEIVSELERLKYPIQKDQAIEYVVRAIPMPVRNGHMINIHLQIKKTPDRENRGQSIACCFVFDDDGNLKYVNNIGFNLSLKEMYPTTFPWAQPSKDNSTILWNEVRERFVKK